MQTRSTVSPRHFGTQGRALLRVAGRKSGENRWVRAFYKAGTVTFRSVRRVLQVLWLEVKGLLFLVLAVVGRRVCADLRVLRREFVLEIAAKIVSGLELQVSVSPTLRDLKLDTINWKLLSAL